MATQDLYEQWKTRVERKAEAKGQKQGRQQGREQGRGEGVQQTLAAVYSARFGRMPEPLRQALSEVVGSRTLDEWVALIGTGSKDDIAAALRNGR